MSLLNYLALAALDFTHAKMANAGRSPYNPADEGQAGI